MHWLDRKPRRREAKMPLSVARGMDYHAYSRHLVRLFQSRRYDRSPYDPLRNVLAAKHRPTELVAGLATQFDIPWRTLDFFGVKLHGV